MSKEKKRKGLKVEMYDSTEERSETSSEIGEAVSDLGKKKKMKLNEEDEEKENPNAVKNFRISAPLREALKNKGIQNFILASMAVPLFNLAPDLIVSQLCLGCIAVGCFELNDDREEQNYIVQVITSKEGRITDDCASSLAGLLPGARALHCDIQHATREVTLSGFTSGKFSTLVATNVAARGLDIDDVQLIIQCEPPRDVEAYIHRSGRTGRAATFGGTL